MINQAFLLDSYFYFGRRYSDGHVKIGITDNPSRRRTEHERNGSFSYFIDFLTFKGYAMASAKNLEDMAIRQFKQYSTRRDKPKNEWFDFESWEGTVENMLKISWRLLELSEFYVECCLRDSYGSGESSQMYFSRALDTFYKCCALYAISHRPTKHDANSEQGEQLMNQHIKTFDKLFEKPANNQYMRAIWNPKKAEKDNPFLPWIEFFNQHNPHI